MADLKRLLAELGREIERISERNDVLERRLSSISGALEGAVRVQGRTGRAEHPAWPTHRPARRALQVRRHGGHAAPEGVREAAPPAPSWPGSTRPRSPPFSAPCAGRARRSAAAGQPASGPSASGRFVQSAAVRAGERVLKGELRRRPAPAAPGRRTHRGSRSRRSGTKSAASSSPSAVERRPAGLRDHGHLDGCHETTPDWCHCPSRHLTCGDPPRAPLHWFRGVPEAPAGPCHRESQCHAGRGKSSTPRFAPRGP